MRLGVLKLTAIQLGGLICMPSLLAGYMLGTEYGLGSAISALLAGNLILLALSLGMLKLTMSRRLTTAEYVRCILGPKGEKLCAFSYIVALTGWFAINQHFMIRQIIALGGGSSPLLFGVGLAMSGLICTYCVCKGLKNLEALARFSLPLMIIIIGIIVYEALSSYQISFSPALPKGSAILFVINMALVMVVDIPTYYRFSTTYRAGALSLILLFALFAPLFQGVGVLLGSIEPSNSSELFDLIRRDSIPLNILHALFFLLAGLTTNNANLYSAVANAKTLLSGSWANRSYLLGGIGTVLSAVNLSIYFEGLLIGMTRCMLVLGMALLVIYLRDPIGSFHSSPSMQRSYFFRTVGCIVSATLINYAAPFYQWELLLGIALILSMGIIKVRGDNNVTIAET